MEALREELARWGLDGRAVRQRMYAAPTPRERERWHALWLLNLGWTNGRVAEALERDAHTIGAWLTDFRGAGPASVNFEHTGSPPALDREQQAALKAAVQRSPQAAGIERANWNWKHPPAGTRREFVQRRFGIRLRRSACRTYLHRLGFVLKRPKKRLMQMPSRLEFRGLASRGKDARRRGAHFLLSASRGKERVELWPGILFTYESRTS